MDMEQNGLCHGVVLQFKRLKNKKTGQKLDEALDLLPEYCVYRDEGCEFAVSCLECPFACCLFERCYSKKHWHNVTRDRNIVKLSKIPGMTTDYLAKRFNISRRSVQRILRRVIQ
jgi:hypothetical protein